MSRTTRLVAALGLLFAFPLLGRAGEDEATAVVNKGIKAHFPNGPDTKNQALRTKSKGNLHIMGLDLPYTQEIIVQYPNKFKEVMDLSFMGQNIRVTSVYNGKDGWIRTQDMDVEITAEILTEFKEATHAMRLMQGVFLKEKGVKLALVGEVQVKGKPAVGVTVSREGYKDVNLFFDKATGLITKVEVRKRDLMSGQEVTEERFITEYQEVAGRKVAKKVEILRDGKEFLEAEMLEVQILEKADDSEFVQPK
jgi:hypothetical protein